METHVCPVCGTAKSYDQFNRHHRKGPHEPWNFRQCKECAHKAYTERYANPNRRAVLNESSNNWKKENPDKHAALAREYRKRHPEKITAQNRLNYAIKKGLVKRLPCEICGSGDRVHAHHVSYDPKDWYNVQWLCHVCHKLMHTDSPT
jgi:hypothetical protein